jgi:Uma2 family endonuclease
MQSVELHKTYTPEEYFSIEATGEQRHEFINGNLIEMSGASREHHFICQNIFLAAKPFGFKVFIENMKVKINFIILTFLFQEKFKQMIINMSSLSLN